MVDIKSTGETINYFLGMTKNLSANGFSFESQNYDIKPGALLEFELKDTDGDFFVHTIGKIVWKKVTDFECLLGVQFQGLGKEVADSIRAMTEDVKKVVDEVPVHESSSVSESEDVEMEEASEQEDGVISNSLSQLKIETEAQDEEKNKEVVIEEPSTDTKPPTEPVHESPIEEITEEDQSEKKKIWGQNLKPIPKQTEESHWYVRAAIIAAVIIAIPSYTIFYVKSDVSEKETLEEISQPLEIVTAPEQPELDVVEVPELSNVEGMPVSVQPEWDMADVPELSNMEDTPVPEQTSEEEVAEDAMEAPIVIAKRLPEMPSRRVPTEPEKKIIMSEIKAVPVVTKAVVSKTIPKKLTVSQDMDKSQTLKAVKETIVKRRAIAPPVEDLPPVPEVVPKKVLAKEVKGVTRAGTAGPGIKLNEKTAMKSKRDVFNVQARVVSPKKAKAKPPVPDVVPGKVIAKPVKGDTDGELVETIVEVDKKLAVKSKVDLLKDEIRAGSREKELTNTPMPVQKVEPKGVVVKVEHRGTGATIPKSAVKPEKTVVVPSPSINNLEKAPPKILVAKQMEKREVVMPSEPEVLKDVFITYEDNFDDNGNNWDAFSTKAASARVEGGEYLLENRRKAGAHLVFHYYEFSHDNDFAIEAPVRTVETSGAYSYGIVFGGKNAFSNYVFKVASDQMFSVIRNHNGRRENLVAGSVQGLSADLHNTIRIVKEGDAVQFLVNGKLLADLKNLVFVGTKVGFILDGKSEIAIDRVNARVMKDVNAEQ